MPEAEASERSMPALEQSLSPWRRAWVYQHERFPVVSTGVLIAVFSFCTVSYSLMTRGVIQVPPLKTYVVAFGCAFLFFLQLRIADEFKDFDEDSRYRPYRPVPRGLVTLRQLGVVAVLTALTQLGLALWLSPAVVPLLLLVWAYLALMSKEFFLRDWLKARPFTYMWSHMFIMPFIDLFGTGTDWAAHHVAPPGSLVWLLIVSYFNGIVIEVGRKIRAPEDEEHGVETYTALWGRSRAVAVWLGALWMTAVVAFVAATQLRFALQGGLLLALCASGATIVAARFLRRPVSRRAKLVETVAGVWTLLMYLSLGALPLTYRLLGGAT